MSVHADSRRVLAAKSKSFDLAAKILPPRSRTDATVLYAWCRFVDDAVDEAPRDEARRNLEQWRRGLATIYGDTPNAAHHPSGDDRGGDAIGLALADVVQRRGIPRAYPAQLLEGMAMDVEGHRYETIDDLLLYCHRAAGTVGLMMAHVLGAERPDALRHAAHLGMGMQLTNIARDVEEDLGRGRVYLPRAWLRDAGAPTEWGQAHDAARGPVHHRPAIAKVALRLLREADRFYASGERGIEALPWRAGFAVRVAHFVYHAIGERLRARGGDPFQGRAVVSTPRKLWLVARALGASWRRGLVRRRQPPVPLTGRPLAYPDDLLLV